MSIRSDIERFELHGKDIRIRLPTLKKPGFSFGNSLPRAMREKSATAPPAGNSVPRSASRDPLNASGAASAALNASGSAGGPPRAPSAGAGALGVGGGGGAAVGVGRSLSNSPLYLDVPRTHQSTPCETSPSAASAYAGNGNGGAGSGASTGPTTPATGNGAAGNNHVPDTLPLHVAPLTPAASSRDSHSPMSLHASPVGVHRTVHILLLP